jgi:hypothetical protein
MSPRRGCSLWRRELPRWRRAERELSIIGGALLRILQSGVAAVDNRNEFRSCVCSVVSCPVGMVLLDQAKVGASDLRRSRVLSEAEEFVISLSSRHPRSKLAGRLCGPVSSSRHPSVGDKLKRCNTGRKSPRDQYAFRCTSTPKVAITIFRSRQMLQ